MRGTKTCQLLHIQTCMQAEKLTINKKRNIVNTQWIKQNKHLKKKNHKLRLLIDTEICEARQPVSCTFFLVHFF